MEAAGAAGASRSGAGKRTRRNGGIDSIPLDSIDVQNGEHSGGRSAARLDAGIGEANRVLGGGIMKGSSVLLGGEPGIGKSTLMLQIAGAVKTKGRVLYVSGEESAGQVKLRADRLAVRRDGIEVLCETDLDRVLTALNAVNPVLVIIDSIQTLVSQDLGAVPGTVNQLKFGCHEIITWAKERNASVFLVAHVTKEGTIAGPKVIEHMVDTVLYFDQSESDLRILRATKNRFGSVDEIGLFTMDERGLSQVRDPSMIFMVQRDGEMPAGVVVAPVYEGSRVLLVELQALVVVAKGGVSRVFSDRIDAGRVSRISAVLEKHLSLRFSDQDVYVNVAGGIRLNEVGVELPLAMALYSARTSVPVPAGTAAAGEITLAGEIRPIPHMARRVRAAHEMKLSSVIGPPSRERSGSSDWRNVSSIGEAVAAVFDSRQR